MRCFLESHKHSGDLLTALFPGRHGKNFVDFHELVVEPPNLLMVSLKGVSGLAVNMNMSGANPEQL